MYASMEDVPWDTDEGDYPNSCQGGSAGVLMTLPAGWHIARDDAQARLMISSSWFATHYVHGHVWRIAKAWHVQSCWMY